MTHKVGDMRDLLRYEKEASKPIKTTGFARFFDSVLAISLIMYLDKTLGFFAKKCLMCHIYRVMPRFSFELYCGILLLGLHDQAL